MRVTDTAAAYGMGGWPFWAVIVGLFVIVMGRSHLFYWLGRGVFSGAARLADRATDIDGHPVATRAIAAPGTTPTPETVRAGEAEGGAPLRARVEQLMHTPTARRALTLVHRWGPLAVTGAYLTVGLQTAVFVASGLLRMPYVRFTLASIPGSVAWSFIWGTVGLGAVWAAARLASASPWALGAAIVVLAALSAWVVARRRARTSETGAAAGQHVDGLA